MSEKELVILTKIVSNVEKIKTAKDKREIIQLYENVRLLAFSGLELHK